MTVTVALATYNGAGYLSEQLQSIVGQTVLPDELVVADDGSTDSTLTILEQFVPSASARGIAVRILTSEGRLGVTANFGRAVSAASGDLIVLCDQDDVWHPDRLEAAVDALPDDVLLQHADADLVDATGAALRFGLLESLRIAQRDREQAASESAFDLYLRRNLATGAVTLFRSELRAAALPFPEEWVHDEWLAILAAAMGRVQILDQRLIDYRQHDSNQIGVQAPTRAARLRRMMAPRGDRYRRFAARAAVLQARLDAIGVRPHVATLAAGKADFERARSRYPAVRIARIGPVLARFVRGDYLRYSSQGVLDVVRDILQPAA